MKTILDTEYGYVKCDIDGDGYNTVRIWEDGDTYGYFRHSNCYRDVEFTGLTKAELLEKIAEDDFLISTRHGRHRMRKFVRELKRKPEPKPEPKTVDMTVGLPDIDVSHLREILLGRGLITQVRSRTEEWAPLDRGSVVRPGTNTHGGYAGTSDYSAAGVVHAGAYTINFTGDWIA